MKTSWAITLVLVLGGALLLAGDDVALRDLLKDHRYANGWIYEDIESGYREAESTGKPLLVCFCCVP